MSDKAVKIYALGGLDEIGKNMYGIEYDNEIIVVDSGLKFPEEHMPGIDLVIPDVSYLLENKEKVRGIFLTHGHEDHIGGLPFVLRKLNVPVFGLPLTIALVKAKLQEHGLLRDVTLNQVNENMKIDFQNFSVSFFRTNHSIPDSMGIVIHTPEGPVIHTGDFKFDLTPEGPPSELSKMAKLGEEGVLALLSDSTNVERSGLTPSEKKVGETIDELFHKCDGRILFATFASNVYRLQQVVAASIKYNRKLAIIGRSMEKVFQIGRELGYIQVPDEMIIDMDKIDQYPVHQVTIICTGSQGEPLAALTRIANGSHRSIQMIPGDTVIFSSSPIPGNTQNVYRTIDLLFRRGADVIYGSLLDIHTSGHGSEEDLKLMLNLIRPKYFVPIHGEFRMMVKHSKLAQQLGVKEENVFLMNNGDTIYLTKQEGKRGKRIPSGYVLVDGNGVGDVGNIVLRDRKQLSESGIIIVVLTVDMKKFQLLAGPDIMSRGFVYVRESEALLKGAGHVTKKIVNQLLEKKIHSWSDWKSHIVEGLNPYFFEKIERSPMILPVIMEVNH